MTLANEQTLWTQFKDGGDDAAREALILEYMRVVKFVAGRMAIHVPSTVEMDDLIGWGVLGLMDAVEKFDPAQDVKFSTYATIRIRGAILDQIRSLDWAPRSLRNLARRVGAARETLRQQLGRDPDAATIASELGVAAAQVEDCLAQLQTAQILSLDDYLPGDDGEAGRKVDVVEGGLPSPEAAARASEKNERLVQAILNLPDQQQKVLNLYYYEELTLKEIGLVLEVTESRVCQIHSAALKRLRQAVQDEG